jgi:MFS family permease
MYFLSLSNEQRANIRHLYFDISWIGITSGTTISFLAIYAARLGASNLQIGLLSAGPAIINLLISLPVGHWLEGRPLVRTAFWSAFWQRIGLIVLIFLPWLLAEAAQTWGIVGLMLVISAPAAILMIAFNTLFADVIPPHLRGEVVGRRNALSAVTTMVSLLVSGQILVYVHYPTNYQIVFAIGAIGAMMSTYHVGRIRSTKEPALQWKWSIVKFTHLREIFLHRLQWKPENFVNGKVFQRLDVLRGPFGLFMTAYLAFYTFQYISISIGPVYFVRTLNLKDNAIGLGSALFNLILMMASMYVGRLATRFSNRRLMVTSGMLFGLYPLIMGLARNAWLYYVGSAVGGIIWAVVNVGMINRLMERVPEDDRPAHMAIHNLVLNLGILVGSLVGPLIGDLSGLRTTMYIGAGLRLLAGVLLWMWG